MPTEQEKQEKQEKRITGKVSIGALRRAAKDLLAFTGQATSVEVELWNFTSGVTEERIKVFLCSSSTRLADSHICYSIAELNEFINKLKTC